MNQTLLASTFRPFRLSGVCWSRFQHQSDGVEGGNYVRLRLSYLQNLSLCESLNWLMLASTSEILHVLYNVIDVLCITEFMGLRH